MALHHEFPLSQSLFSPPTTLWSLLLIAGLICVAFWQIRKRPWLSFFMLWYFLTLMIESTILPLEIIFEHRVYLPSIGIAAILVYPFLKFSRQPAQKRVWYFALVLWILWGGLCLNWSWQRNAVWKDEISLWEANARAYPHSDRVQNNLAAAYENIGNFPRAELAYQEAVRSNPQSALARANLALFYLNRGRSQEAAQTLAGIPSKEMNSIAYYALAAVEADRKNWASAIPYLQKALARSMFFPQAQYQLGIAYTKTGQAELARETFREFLRTWTGDPASPQAERARLELQHLETPPANIP
jgi:tetratricopeptide (TPR) repeat protein